MNLFYEDIDESDLPLLPAGSRFTVVYPATDKAPWRRILFEVDYTTNHLGRMRVYRVIDQEPLSDAACDYFTLLFADLFPPQPQMQEMQEIAL